MSIIHSTTGHSQKEEKKVARILYIAIGIAVAIGIVIAFMASRNRKLDPAQSVPTQQTIPAGEAPAAGSTAPQPAADSPANQ